MPDVEKSFRRLAKIHHPDKNFGSKESKEHFSRITSAYNNLVQILKIDTPKKGNGADSSPFTGYSKKTGLYAIEEQIPVRISFKEFLKGTIKTIKLRRKKLSKMNKSLSVHIPAGTKDKTLLRLKEAGLALFPHETPPDLIISVRVKRHRRFSVDGFDLYTTHECSQKLLNKGGAIHVKTPLKTCRIYIAPNTPFYTWLRIKNQGVQPNSASKHPGNLFVQVIPKRSIFRRLFVMSHKKYGQYNQPTEDHYWQFHNNKMHRNPTPHA